jgi:cell division protein ZapA
MSEEIVGISVEIMDKIYQVKCPEAEVNSLQRAAQYLEEKMRVMRQTGTLSVERIAIITALNIVHQLLMTEQQKNHHFQSINQRLQDLHLKIDQAITENAQMELETANAY